MLFRSQSSLVPAGGHAGEGGREGIGAGTGREREGSNRTARATRDSFPRKPGALLAKAEAPDERQVTVAVRLAQVLEQTVALADHHQKAAPAGVVLLVHLEMFRKLGDPCRQKRNLNLGRAGVLLVVAVLFDDTRLGISSYYHRFPTIQNFEAYGTQTLANNALTGTLSDSITPFRPGS